MRRYIIPAAIALVTFVAAFLFIHFEERNQLLRAIRLSDVDKVRKITGYPGTDEMIKDFARTVNEKFPGVRLHRVWDGRLPAHSASGTVAELHFGSSLSFHHGVGYPVLSSDGEWGALSYQFDHSDTTISIRIERNYP